MNLLRRVGWFTGLLMFSMPVLLITFLGFMMARGQVKSEFDHYQAIQEYTSLSALSAAPAESVVMVRGRIAEGPSPDWADGLVIFQERPLAGRELRYDEEFPLVFPEFTLQLSDGALLIEPGDAQVISHETARVADAVQKREYTGFRLGDEVTVQGNWQGIVAGTQAMLPNASGITSLDRAGVIADGQDAFHQLDIYAMVLGILSLLALVLLIMQLWRNREQEKLATPVSA